jgi:hypothetical protein
MVRRSSSLALTPDRAARLCRLLQLLAAGPQTRASLMRRLRLNVRGFYRDLEVLRAAGIVLILQERHYLLEGDADAAVSRLPLPDPHLTLGEAQQLAKGRTRAHQKLKAQLAQILK